jgi:hypothetical protein
MSANPLVDTPRIADGIGGGVSAFAEAVPSLTKVLVEVAKVYPFISGEVHPPRVQGRAERSFCQVKIRRLTGCLQCFLADCWFEKLE